MRPVLLDLYAGAGGAGMGYAYAGFDVFAVDIAPQINNPFEFLQADVTDMDLIGLARGVHAAAIHASPPCQRDSRLRFYQPETIEAKYADLIAPTREMLIEVGLPYVIENVETARHKLRDPITLCGAMFSGLRVYRHRCFELSFAGVWTPEHPRHVARCVRNGYLPADDQYMSIHGGKHSKAWQVKAAQVMGTPWMRTISEVCESIPPSYTRHIGSQLIAQLQDAAA